MVNSPPPIWVGRYSSAERRLLADQSRGLVVQEEGGGVRGLERGGSCHNIFMTEYWRERPIGSRGSRVAFTLKASVAAAAESAAGVSEPAVRRTAASISSGQRIIHFLDMYMCRYTDERDGQ